MIHLIIYLALIGFITFLVVKFIPMAEPFKYVIYAIAAICVIYLLMGAFGIADVPIPRLGAH